MRRSIWGPLLVKFTALNLSYTQLTSFSPLSQLNHVRTQRRIARAVTNRRARLQQHGMTWLLRPHVDGLPVEEHLERARLGDDEGTVEAMGCGRGVGVGVRVEVEPVDACRHVFARSTYREESLPHHVLEAVNLCIRSRSSCSYRL